MAAQFIQKRIPHDGDVLDARGCREARVLAVEIDICLRAIAERRRVVIIECVLLNGDTGRRIVHQDSTLCTTEAQIFNRASLAARERDTVAVRRQGKIKLALCWSGQPSASCSGSRHPH